MFTQEIKDKKIAMQLQKINKLQENYNNSKFNDFENDFIRMAEPVKKWHYSQKQHENLNSKLDKKRLKHWEDAHLLIEAEKELENIKNRKTDEEKKLDWQKILEKQEIQKDILKIGDKVKCENLKSQGVILKINKKTATIQFEKPYPFGIIDYPFNVAFAFIELI